MSASDIFSEGISPGLLTNITCSGSETELLQCMHNTSRGLSCDTAGIICQGTFIIYCVIIFSLYTVPKVAQLGLH